MYIMSDYVAADREQLKRLDQESLIELILVLQEQLAAHQVLIQALQDQLAKDSRNSGKPPSSDGLKKRRNQSLRQSGKRPRGGQPGHKGQTLTQVEEPQHVIRHALPGCPHCQTELKAVAAVGQVKRQVFDIPPLGIEVTEHQAEVKQCPGCGVRVQAAFPAGVSQPTQYGPRLKAQACYLHNYQLIPLARTTELLTDFYGHAPSEAVLIADNRQLVTRTQASRGSISMRVEGRLSGCTSLPPYRRGHVGMRAGGILSSYPGVAVHDHWASYLQFPDCQHAFCNVHHLRELRFIHEQLTAWAEEMARAHHQGKRCRSQALIGSGRILLKQPLSPLQCEYARLGAPIPSECESLAYAKGYKYPSINRRT